MGLGASECVLETSLVLSCLNSFLLCVFVSICLLLSLTLSTSLIGTGVRLVSFCGHSWPRCRQAWARTIIGVAVIDSNSTSYSQSHRKLMVIVLAILLKAAITALHQHRPDKSRSRYLVVTCRGSAKMQSPRPWQHPRPSCREAGSTGPMPSSAVTA